MKRELTDTQDDVAAKKVVGEDKTPDTLESNRDDHTEALPDTIEKPINVKEPESPENPKDEASSKGTSSTDSSEKEKSKTPTLKSGNPLLAGSFASSFKTSGFSSFGSKAKPSENPWTEKKSNPWSEKKDESPQEEKKSEEPEKKQDQYAVVSLERQEVKTGEEEEQTLFNVRAKLYAMNLKDTVSGWKERGVGMLHLNLSEAQSKSRVLMRADTLHKVILNTTLGQHTEIHRGFQSSAQTAKFVRLTGSEPDGALYQYALRLQTPELADKLYEHLTDLCSSRN